MSKITRFVAIWLSLMTLALGFTASAKCECSWVCSQCVSGTQIPHCTHAADDLVYDLTTSACRAIKPKINKFKAETKSPVQFCKFYLSA